MSIEVSFDIDSTVLNKKLTGLTREVLPKVLARSSNQAAISGRAESAKRIRASYNIKSKAIKDRLAIKKVFPNTTNLSSLNAEINILKKGIGLSKFGAKKAKKGVSFRVKKTRKVIRRAFIAKMKSGHIGVFIREKGEKKIRELYSTSPVDLFNSKEFMKEIKAFTANRYRKVFSENFKFYTSRL